MIKERVNTAVLMVGISLCWIVMAVTLWEYEGALVNEGALIQLWMIRAALILSLLMLGAAWAAYIWRLGKAREKAASSMAGEATLSLLSALATLALDLLARNDLIRELSEEDKIVIITGITEEAFKMLVVAGAINEGFVDTVGLDLQEGLERALTDRK